MTVLPNLPVTPLDPRPDPSTPHEVYRTDPATGESRRVDLRGKDHAPMFARCHRQWPLCGWLTLAAALMAVCVIAQAIALNTAQDVVTLQRREINHLEVALAESRATSALWTREEAVQTLRAAGWSVLSPEELASLNRREPIEEYPETEATE